MFACNTVLCKYMKSLKVDVNLSSNMHVRSKIYCQFYHGIVYIANEQCHIRISP